MSTQILSSARNAFVTTRNDSPPRTQAEPAARRACLELAALPSEVPQARHYLRDTLTAWGLSRVSDDIELIACELLTNAISASAALPSPASVGLLVTADPDRLVVTVRDASAEGPARPDHDDDAVAGRGLAIVDALSTAWGWAPDPPGKVIWAAVDL
jgi:anti-sigma regulatory factor (Ser/Thr protein kinase)